MVGDLKGIKLDQIKVGSNTPQQNRQYTQEAMLKVNFVSLVMSFRCPRDCLTYRLLQALFVVYAINASKETNGMKERLASLNDQISYLRVEGKKMEKELEVEKKEKLSLADKLSKLNLHTKELEGKAELVVALECDIEALQRENAKLRSKLKDRDG
ncbi:hypothetical protein ACLB2K_031353 [Fragaria x ananassa]